MSGVIFRRIGGRIIPIISKVKPVVKNIAIGTTAGYLSGRSVAAAEGEEISGKKGAKIGAFIGAVASIPPRPVGQVVKHFARNYLSGVRLSQRASRMRFASKMKKP
jgi:outer membrane lipoprotein SlyB